VTEPIRPISRRDLAPVEPVIRVSPSVLAGSDLGRRYLRLLTPAEREEARRNREELRKRRAAKDRQK
jgi:hypothetical protein